MEKIMLEGREITCRKFYRKVRSPRLEIENGELSLILPLKFSGEQKLVGRHRKWIIRQIDRFEEIRTLSKTMALRSDMSEKEFRIIAEKKTNGFCGELGVNIDRISFRKLKSRWGSCSTDGKITVNTFLRFLPDRLIDYILFHEVAHRIEKGHNRNFYAIIENRFDNREILEKELAAYWHLFSKSLFTLE